MKPDWKPLTLITQVGLTIVAALILCLLAGIWLDAKFGTHWVFTLAFSLVGIAAGSIGVYRQISAAIADSVSEIETRKAARAARESTNPPSARRLNVREATETDQSDDSPGGDSDNYLYGEDPDTDSNRASAGPSGGDSSGQSADERADVSGDGSGGPSVGRHYLGKEDR